MGAMGKNTPQIQTSSKAQKCNNKKQMCSPARFARFGDHSSCVTLTCAFEWTGPMKATSKFPSKWFKGNPAPKAQSPAAEWRRERRFRPVHSRRACDSHLAESLEPRVRSTSHTNRSRSGPELCGLSPGYGRGPKPFAYGFWGRGGLSRAVRNDHFEKGLPKYEVV